DQVEEVVLLAVIALLRVVPLDDAMLSRADDGNAVAETLEQARASLLQKFRGNGTGGTLDLGLRARRQESCAGCQQQETTQRSRHGHPLLPGIPAAACRC